MTGIMGYQNIILPDGAHHSVTLIEGVGEDVMSDESMRIEWHDCEECGSEYTWFRIEVIEGVEMYGWVHLIQLWGRADRCPRDREMGLVDSRCATN